MSHNYSTMSQAQIEEFLEAPRFATFATNRRDGPPQLTPVWYLYENGLIYVSMYAHSAKYRNLSRDPRIGICIAGNHPDARGVMIYGTAGPVREREAVIEDFVWRITRRYHDSDEETQAYIESAPIEGGGALVALTPEKIIAEDYN